MKALLFFAAALTGLACWYFRCKHVDAKRHYLGGYVCACGATFDSMPTLDKPYLNPLRRIFERDPQARIRKAGW